MNNDNSDFSKGEFTSLLLASLRGFSQVVFIENVISGVLILLAITISSYKLGIISLLSSIVGTLIGKIGGAPKNSVNSGLFGYNSVLTGLAVSLFLTGPSKWGIALLGAMIAAIFTATMMHFLKNIDLPILTFPFIVLTWFVLLASYKLDMFHLSDSLVPQSLAYWQLNIAGELNWTAGFLNNIEQIFFLNHPISGVLLYSAIFVASWQLGLHAVIGSIIALLLSYVLGGEHALILGGLYGYNAILTCMAVSIVFSSQSNRFKIVSGILATCLTIPLTASFSTWLLPYGLPVLTMPFVVSTWLFLGARKMLPNL